MISTVAAAKAHPGDPSGWVTAPSVIVESFVFSTIDRELDGQATTRRV
ncbi:Uncharacterised protein [Mycobacteroides abscessus subsp. massiliense]|nr:Uncharacterised protein [Mycobacteroides abscessus subsp. massiliense]SKH44304.1 Uncharacterised protein [Mycobacteroides abscessus subsp. massiliense]SKH89445.1 Uncharacterised protein [Mycobacteroides abscessus subsp. massiliense]SKI74502.1 Uncharacterised protein [Mycobacteroides abscessus subsp. massiliense]SKI88088.1 Uncharacterised protein [Mycobacteroides abscessus subsp. massiliense]